MSTNWDFRMKSAGNGFIVHSADNHDELVCDVFMTNDATIARKRAYLIAAAPELYEAVQTTLIILNINRKYVECEPLEKKLRAALKKADGK